MLPVEAPEVSGAFFQLLLIFHPISFLLIDPFSFTLTCLPQRQGKDERPDPAIIAIRTPRAFRHSCGICGADR